RRGVFERAAQSARDPVGTSDDRGLANDFWRSASARHRIQSGGKSAALSLERLVYLLFALPGRDRFGAQVFASLLAPAANDRGQFAGDLARHAAGCRGARMGNRWREIFSLVTSRRVFRARWCVDDFSPS